MAIEVVIGAEMAGRTWIILGLLTSSSVALASLYLLLDRARARGKSTQAIPHSLWVGCITTLLSTCFGLVLALRTWLMGANLVDAEDHFLAFAFGGTLGGVILGLAYWASGFVMNFMGMGTLVASEELSEIKPGKGKPMEGKPPKGVYDPEID